MACLFIKAIDLTLKKRMVNTKGKRFFYGWVIAATGFLIWATFASGLYYSFGIFFPVMMSDLGFSRGEGGTAFSVMVLVQSLGGPLVGAAIIRFGLKRVMVTGNILIIITMVLMSRATMVWHLYFVYGILGGLAILSAGFISIFTMINNWFQRRRGLAIAICAAGGGLGTIILAPTYSYLIEIIGWRNTWLALAGIATVLALLPTIFLVRPRPEDMGQEIDGGTSGSAEGAAPLTTTPLSPPVDCGPHRPY